MRSKWYLTYDIWQITILDYSIYQTRHVCVNGEFSDQINSDNFRLQTINRLKMRGPVNFGYNNIL